MDPRNSPVSVLDLRKPRKSHTLLLWRPWSGKDLCYVSTKVYCHASSPVDQNLGRVSLMKSQATAGNLAVERSALLMFIATTETKACRRLSIFLVDC
jgi:hypothetical protein